MRVAKQFCWCNNSRCCGKPALIICAFTKNVALIDCWR